MEKWATPEGTQKFFQWNSIEPSKRHAFDGLELSALGIGTYLGESDAATDRLYEKALVQAGLSGINCFDTAINYRSQRSEKVLKKALKELAHRGLFREQLFISTKGGFLPSEGTPEQYEEYVRAELFDKGVIESKDIVAESHCMTPDFLEHQIHASLKNLGLDSIDLYYLHNPEIQLEELGEKAFYPRLEAAFQLFEKKVQEKKIRRYGLATWDGFRQKKSALQLGRVLECAQKAGGEGHHFKAIQLPFNLIMLEALKNKNQSGNLTIFQAAEKLKVAVFTSSCLMQSQVTHIAQRIYDQLPPAPTAALQAIEFVLSTPPICTAYAGMRHVEHLLENGKVLQEPSWSKEVWSNACHVLGL